MYIVKLLAKDGNEDCQFVNVEVNCNNEEIAINKAVDFYYEKYWTNTEWRKEDFENEMIKIKSKIELLSKDLLISVDKLIDINEYESNLRNYLGSSDKSLEDFSKMALYLKIRYLSEIGCQLSYFVYPKKSKFENVSI